MGAASLWMGAASLWMESTRTGDADASKGSSDKAKYPFMIQWDSMFNQSDQDSICDTVSDGDGG